MDGRDARRPGRLSAAHALYVKAIHGGKKQERRIDSEKLPHLLRSKSDPPAMMYPASEPLRALLSQRSSMSGAASELWRASTPIKWITIASPRGPEALAIPWERRDHGGRATFRSVTGDQEPLWR